MEIKILDLLWGSVQILIIQLLNGSRRDREVDRRTHQTREGVRMRTQRMRFRVLTSLQPSSTVSSNPSNGHVDIYLYWFHFLLIFIHSPLVCYNAARISHLPSTPPPIPKLYVSWEVNRSIWDFWSNSLLHMNKTVFWRKVHVRNVLVSSLPSQVTYLPPRLVTVFHSPVFPTGLFRKLYGWRSPQRLRPLPFRDLQLQSL